LVEEIHHLDYCSPIYLWLVCQNMMILRRSYDDDLLNDLNLIQALNDER
jgi:hypothetical protein